MNANLIRFFSVAAALLAGGLIARGSDWPRWGGPDPGRNMCSTETGLPDHFASGTNGQIGLKPGTDEVDVNNIPNVKWAVKIG
jgi:hypothetical protein